MAHEMVCEHCDERLVEDSYEGVIKAAAAHNHDHHGGPAEITPEIEAALRGRVREV